MPRPALSTAEIQEALARELAARGVDAFDLKVILVGRLSDWRAVAAPHGGRIDEAVSAAVFEAGKLLAAGYDLAPAE